MFKSTNTGMFSFFDWLVDEKALFFRAFYKKSGGLISNIIEEHKHKITVIAENGLVRIKVRINTEIVQDGERIPTVIKREKSFIQIEERFPMKLEELFSGNMVKRITQLLDT